MNIVAWNIRGLGNKPSMRRLKRIFKSKKICFAAIFEPKIDNAMIKECMLKLKCVQYACNDEGNIWLLWNTDITCTILQSSAQFISVKVHLTCADIILTCVHASCDPTIRLNAWNDFISSNYNEPWMLLGDFNSITGQNEESGVG